MLINDMKFKDVKYNLLFVYGRISFSFSSFLTCTQTIQPVPSKRVKNKKGKKFRKYLNSGKTNISAPTGNLFFFFLAFYIKFVVF